MDLGTALRNARERAGFSLEELAARTRIPRKTLQAIEDNAFDRIPAGIFARSFIRGYAREVGADPVEAVEEYRRMTDPVVETTAGTADRPLEHTPPRSFQPELLTSPPSWGYAVVVAALFVAVVVMNRYTETEDQQPAAAAQVAERAAAEPAHVVATSGRAIHIEMRAQRPCWVRAVVDGEVAFARLLQPGESETVSGQRDVVMRVGDPSALSYSVNGQPGESLGTADVPVTVRFGADGRSSRAS